MTIKDGGPAFPCSEERWINPMNIKEGTYYPDGMTLRDYFAAKALQSFMLWSLDQRPFKDYDTAAKAAAAYAKSSYSIADAMLKAREQ